MPSSRRTHAGRRRDQASGRNETFHERALDASGAGMWFWDVENAVSYWDARFGELYGFRAEEPASYQAWLGRVHPDDRESVRARVESLLQSGGHHTWNEEFRALHPEKGMRWMEGLGAVERAADGRALRFSGINIDITERKRADEVLRKNLERSEEIAHIGHWLWRVADNRVAWSDEVYRIFGVTPGAALPGIETLARAVHPEDRARLARFGKVLLKGSVPDEVIECRIVAADGMARHILGTISSCHRDRDGTITQMSGIVHDVTARKTAEAEVLRIGEEERHRIAADLHDGVLQELAGIAYLTASVRAELEGERDEGLAARVRRIEQAIVQAIDHTRHVACTVDPMLPGGNGLMGALRYFVGTIEDTYATQCTLRHDPQDLRIDDAVIANQLYRIAQEAIRNAVRHGKAAHVTVRVHEAADEVCLTVSDDGCGVPERAVEGAGMGLHVMRYRAALIGGQLTIRPRAGGGTEVSCRYPRLADPLAPQPRAGAVRPRSA